MDNTLIVNSLFSKDEINTLKKLIGLCLDNVQIQRPSVLLPPNGYIQGIGTVALNFFGTSNSLIIIMESLYDEHLELGDIGGVKILHSFTSLWTAGESLKSNFDVRGRDAVRFTYTVPPKVSSISCFGWKGRGTLSNHGARDDVSSNQPERKLVVDTIEFLVLEMNDFSKLILQSSNGGFFCYFEPSGSDIVDRLNRDYEDEITLQHFIH